MAVGTFDGCRARRSCGPLRSGGLLKSPPAGPCAGTGAAAEGTAAGREKGIDVTFNKDDRVAWNTPQGKTHGTVRSTHTKDFEFKDQTFRAAEDDPVYVVESEKTGSRAAHHGSALTHADKGKED